MTDYEIVEKFFKKIKQKCNGNCLECKCGVIAPDGDDFICAIKKPYRCEKEFNEIMNYKPKSQEMLEELGFEKDDYCVEPSFKNGDEDIYFADGELIIDILFHNYTKYLGAIIQFEEDYKEGLYD